MVSVAFSWDALAWYNIRSLGHYVLEATSIGNDTVTLVDVDDIATLTVGDEVQGFVDGKDADVVTFYVTDVTDDQLALQDIATSFGYVRDKQTILLQ